MGFAMTRHDSTDPYAALLGALDDQSRLVRELEELCGRQKQAIAKDDAEGVLGLLAARQGVIEHLTRMDREVANLRVGVDASGQGLAPNQRQEISLKAGTIALAIQRVMASDAADREVLEQRRGVIAAQLAEISGKRRAVSAYGGGRTDGGAMFQDRRG